MFLLQNIPRSKRLVQDQKPKETGWSSPASLRRPGRPYRKMTSMLWAPQQRRSPPSPAWAFAQSLLLTRPYGTSGSRCPPHKAKQKGSLFMSLTRCCPSAALSEMCPLIFFPVQSCMFQSTVQAAPFVLCCSIFPRQTPSSLTTPRQGVMEISCIQSWQFPGLGGGDCCSSTIPAPSGVRLPAQVEGVGRTWRG